MNANIGLLGFHLQENQEPHRKSPFIFVIAFGLNFIVIFRPASLFFFFFFRRNFVSWELNVPSAPADSSVSKSNSLLFFFPLTNPELFYSYYRLKHILLRSNFPNPEWKKLFPSLHPMKRSLFRKGRAAFPISKEVPPLCRDT
jgi:hypothetical protein